MSERETRAAETGGAVSGTGSRALKAWQWFRGSRLRSALAVTLVGWVAAYFYLAKPEHKDRGSFLTRADGTWMYLQLRSHVLDRDVDYRNDYAVVGSFHGRPKWDIWLGHTDRGMPHNPWTLGTGVLLAPFFVLGHGLVLLANLFGARLDTFGTSLVHQYVTFLGSALWAFWGLVLLVRLCARRFGETPALVGCLGVMLAGPLFYYSTYCPSYSHAVAFFCAAALLWWWDAHLRPAGSFVRWRPPPAGPEQLELPLETAGSSAASGAPRLRSWLAFGALTGLAALVRPQLVIFALPGALTWPAHLWRTRRDVRSAARLGLGAALAVAAALLVFLPQMLYWKHLHGFCLVVPQGAWFMQWDGSFMWQTLFSARAGLFVVTPLMWIAGLGLLLSARRYPGDAALLTGIVLLSAFVNGSAWDFWGGGTFGARRMTAALGSLMFGAAALVAMVADLARRRRRLVGWVTAALLVAPLGAFTHWQMREVSERARMSSQWPDRDMTFYWKAFLTDVQNEYGNPLTYPHALWTWARHGVPVSRYSRVMADLPLDWPPPWRATDNRRSLERVMDLTTPRWMKLVAGGGRQVTLARQQPAWQSQKECIRLFLLLRTREKYRLRFMQVASSRPTLRPPVPPPPPSAKVSLVVNDHRALTWPWSKTIPRGVSRGLRGLKVRWYGWDIPPRMVNAGLNHLKLCGPEGRLVLRRMAIAYRR